MKVLIACEAFPGIAAAMAEQWGGPFSRGHENDTGGRHESAT